MPSLCWPRPQTCLQPCTPGQWCKPAMQDIYDKYHIYATCPNMVSILYARCKACSMKIIVLNMRSGSPLGWRARGLSIPCSVPIGSSSSTSRMSRGLMRRRKLNITHVYISMHLLARRFDLRNMAARCSVAARCGWGPKSGGHTSSVSQLCQAS